MTRRIEVLRSTRLLDSAPEPAFDRLTRLAGTLIGAPVALISLVDETRQFFKSSWGLGEPWASRRETPLSYSFCDHVVHGPAPLIVADAREHPVLNARLAVAELGVIAYAGVPLIVDGAAIGALCVIDAKPRAWTEADVRLLRDLADSVVSEIELRVALREANERRALIDALVDSMGDAVLAIDPERNFIIANQAARRAFGAQIDVGHPLPADWTAQHRARRIDGSPLPVEDGALARALRGEASDGLTFALPPHDGGAEPLWLEASGRPVRDREGAVVAAIVIYRDATARTRQADRYSTLVGNIPRGMVALFDHELRCLAADGVLIRERALDPQRLVGQTMRSVAGPAGGPQFDAVEAVYRRTLAGESLTHDLRWDDRVAALHTAPVRDELGRITAGLVLAIDCTAERSVQAELHHREQIYRAIVKHLPNGAVLMIDRELRYLAADGPIIEDLMRSANVTEMVGRTVAEVASDETREAMMALYADAFEGVRHHREIMRGGRFYDLHTVPIFEADQISHTLVFLYDVTERKREAEELRWTRDQLVAERQLFEVTLDHIDDGVALLDANLRILLTNPAFGQMFGLQQEQLRGLSRSEFVAHIRDQLEDAAVAVARLESQRLESSEEFVFVRPRQRVLRRTWLPVRMVDADGFLVTWHDITSEKALLAEHEHQLLVDALTGIPNRRAALGVLKVEHSRMRRTGLPLSVALLDIDHFKHVNDEYGHATGDRVLCQVAMVLAREARDTDTVARWGGEEFLAILPGSLAGARTFCERARAAIQNLVCPGVRRITTSVGVAEVGPAEDPADAIARADQLLYEAKRAGRNRVAS